MAVVVLAAATWHLLPGFDSLQPEREELSIVMVTTDEVNLRAGPGTSFGVLAVIPSGTEVAANTDLESGFLQVSASGKQGWISAEYLAARDSVSAQSHVVEAASFQAHQPAQASGVSVVPDPPPEPTAEPVAAKSIQVKSEPRPGEKWIEVNRTTGLVTLHNGEIIVAEFDALVGKDLSADGYYSTALGTFYVHLKEKSLAETPFAEGVYLTDFVGFDPDRSNGFHSPVRDEHGNVVVTGGTTTLGCVRLSEDDAIFLFNFAHIGMRVEVHD